MPEQRKTYRHENPVSTGFVELAENRRYNSAAAYYAKDHKELSEIVSVY